MRMTRLALLLLVASASLAGCSGKAAKTAADGLDANAAGIDVKATDTTGVIRGVVVDTGIRPIGNVQVTTQTEGRTLMTNTTPTGAFGFEGLPAGTYFLKTHKAGFADTQSSVDVKAGDSTPALTKIQLVADASTAPSFDIYVFKGFMQCSILTGPFFQPCYMPAIGPLPEVVVGDDHSYTQVNITGNVTYLEVDMVWTPTQSFGTELYFNACYDQKSYPDHCLMYMGGASPLVTNVTGSDAHKYEQSGQVYFEAATHGVGDVLPENDVRRDPGGASINQDFVVYFVVCHGFQPPAGYSFARDGEPKVPA
ncbi:MAG TPA: carboxypeptidase-like regulatory domain-containing protein [Candidatus Thermoplasmatota archaeon]|nr:carboxypeptidase-like regulatory domain-containing protein [Candidatus Thermoplasmatota archaeon]